MLAVSDALRDFLSRLCGGELKGFGMRLMVSFLSRLCGGEYDIVEVTDWFGFLSRLCGGEFYLGCEYLSN